MNDRQRRFVEEYLVDLNATQAAIRAGYAERTARSQGQRLLTKVDVAAEIEKRQAERSERTEISQDYVVSKLQSVAERCMQAEPVMNRDGTQAITEDPNGDYKLAYTFNAAGANRALELLGKHLGMFADKHEHTSPDGSMSPPQRIEIVAPENGGTDGA